MKWNSRVFISAVCLLSLACGTRADEEKKFELFGGYSFVRPPVPGSGFAAGCDPTRSTCPPNTGSRINANGWDASVAYRVRGTLSLKADVSGAYGSIPSAPLYGTGSVTEQVRLYTLLFGPQWRLEGKASPFVHAMIGGAREQNRPGDTAGGYGPAENGFAAAFGGGLDLKAAGFLWIRPAGLDYLVTRLRSETQNQIRFSAGVTIRF